MYKMKKDILHPMLYKDKRTINLLYNDIYEGYHFYILNLGTHPTAYIEIPKGNKLFGVGYSNIDIDVHGGLTYDNNYLQTSDGNRIVNSWFIGWDYGHCDDYIGYEMNFPEEIRTNGKKWTTEEIIIDCIDAIEQIKRMADS